MNKKLAIGILVLGVFMVSAFSPAVAQTANPVKNPGVYIRENHDLSYSNLDPATNYESGGSGLNSMVCETLYDYVGDSLTDLAPALAAADPVVSSDGLQYNVSLKHGVKFHDGVEFNAWVYKYSIDRVLLINDHNSAGFLLAMIAGADNLLNEGNLNATSQNVTDYFNAGGVKVLDDYTIQFNLDYAYSAFWPAMTYQVACAVSPLFVTSTIPSDYVADETDDTYGMIDLANWFPELSGDYTKLGLSGTHDSKNSGVVPSSPEGDDNQHDGYIDEQVGTGPWVLTSKTQEVIQLDRNMDWWSLNASYGSGYVEPDNVVDQILIKAVSDPATRALSLKEGDADSVQIDPEFVDEFLNPDGTTKLAQVKAYKYSTLNIGFWGFNQANGDDLDPGSVVYSGNDGIWTNQTLMDQSGLVAYNHLKNEDGTDKHPNITNPFTALNFRKAFSYAFDYDAYIDTALNGFATRLEGLIPDGLLGHQDDLIDIGLIPEYDPDTAKALFEEVGWKGAITIAFNSASAARRTAANLLQSSIDSLNVGIEIFVHEMLWSTFLLRYYTVPMFLLGWAPDFADPDNYMTPFVHSTKGYYSARISYYNTDWDAKLQAATDETDPVARDALYRELEMQIANETIFMYTNQGEAVTTMHYWWHGWENSGSENPMRNFRRVHYMEKYDTPLPTITTTTTTTTSGGGSTSDTGASSSSGEPAGNGAPGFELLALMSGLVAVTLVARKRRK